MPLLTKVDLTQIPSEGVKVSESFGRKDLDIETHEVRLLDEVCVEATIKNIGKEVEFSGRVRGTISVCCSRCLDEFRVNLDKKVNFTYPVDRSSPVVDILEDIREDIILGYSMKYLCSEDCKGICPRCGKNLNREKCICS